MQKCVRGGHSADDISSKFCFVLRTTVCVRSGATAVITADLKVRLVLFLEFIWRDSDVYF